MSDNEQFVVCDGHMQSAPSHISQCLSTWRSKSGGLSGSPAIRAEHAGLLDAVKANVPKRFHAQLVHRCRLDSRQFVYRVKQNELPMSVVETER